MKFILFVEGYTEENLPAFLKKWLDPRLSKAVGIKSVRFDGWKELVKDTPLKAGMYLNGPKKDEIIAVFALLDLYGPTFYPDLSNTANERYDWAKNYLESKVKHPKFRQFFAVHEVEAWLISEPNIFPSEIKKALASSRKPPEQVNCNEHPSILLQKLYFQKLGRNYKKVTNGSELFGKLNPEIAVEKCPKLKELLTEMLNLAKEAGL
jgi:hypothetical protein